MLNRLSAISPVVNDLKCGTVGTAEEDYFCYYNDIKMQSMRIVHNKKNIHRNK